MRHCDCGCALERCQDGPPSIRRSQNAGGVLDAWRGQSENRKHIPTKMATPWLTDAEAVKLMRGRLDGVERDGVQVQGTAMVWLEERMTLRFH